MKYQINSIELLTGIKTHTIRIWEKRYNILSPKRTETNIRYYDEDDLKKIILVVTLVKNGYKISEISKFSEQQLKDTVLLESKQYAEYETHISLLLDSIINFEQADFSNNFAKIAIQFGFENVFGNIILPVLRKLNIFWRIDKINKAQLNYGYNIVNQLISVFYGNLPIQNNNNKNNFLIFSTSNFYDSIISNYINFLLAKQNAEVINIGVCINNEQIKNILEQKHCDNIIVILGESDNKILPFIKSLPTNFAKQKIYVVDYFNILKESENITVINKQLSEKLLQITKTNE